MKDERLQLALEVCTKCGVEGTGVWLAWGRACLQCGDFAGARDKFGHCLKVHAPIVSVSVCVSVVTSLGPGTSSHIASGYMVCWGVGRWGWGGALCVCVSLW